MAQTARAVLRPDAGLTRVCVADRVTLATKQQSHTLDGSETNLVVYIDQQVGMGSFGQILRGQFLRNGQSVDVAVKASHVLEDLELYNVGDADTLQTYLKTGVYAEINSLLLVHHPNIVKLVTVGMDQVYGVPYPRFIALSYCNFGTLQAWLDDGHPHEDDIDQCELAVFVEDFLTAMVFLHVDKNALHRDIKPANIFISNNFESPPRGTTTKKLVLGDLGSLKRLERETHVSGFGSPVYTAPEVSANGCSKESDVFSMSLVLVEMCTKIRAYKTVLEERAPIIEEAIGKLPVAGYRTVS